MSAIHLPRFFSSIEPVNRQSRYLVAVVLGAIAFWALSILVAGLSSKLYLQLAGEDGSLEYAQVAILLGSSLMGGYIAVLLSRARDRVWAGCYALGALVLLWMAGEEISWGQRIFGLSTPEVLAPNVQGELNLHNLPGVTSRMHLLLEISLVVVSVLSIAVWTRAPAALRRWRVHLWLPQPMLIGMWLCFLSYSWIRALDQWYFGLEHVHFVVSQLQESAELILYAGVLVFLVMVAAQVREEPRSRPVASV
jgi:hypothetical protein